VERRTYTLSDEKKIELFLSYINRMVDLLFR
jgi:cob(I)alamin adenosyltransferase